MKKFCTALFTFLAVYAHAQKIDLTFSPVISVAGPIHRVVAQPDDKLIVASSHLSSMGGQRISNIVRLHSDGTLDDTFQPGTGFTDESAVSSNFITDVILAPDGKILVSGAFTSYNGTPIRHIARLNPDGTLDESFNVGEGPNQAAEALAVQADGKVIVAGGFTQFNGTAKNFIVRLNSDGTVDDAFNPIIENADFYIVNAVAVQPDNKVLVGGYFSSVNGEAKSNLVRLNADGSNDQSFAGVISNKVYSFALLSDEQIVVGGEGVLTRLNADGTVNQSFNDIYGSQTVYDLAIQADNKIIAVGTFSVSADRIARFNVGGTQDNTFNSSQGLSHLAKSVCVLTTGKVVVSGWFNKYKNVLRSGLVCVNTDGSIDLNFDPKPGTLATIIAMEHQSDGKLLIGGAFNFVNGTAVNNIARLNPDGTVDNSFSTTGSGLESTVTSIKQIQNGPHAGKLMVGGYFGNYNGLPSTRNVVRLQADGQLDNTFSSTVFSNFGYVTSLQISGDDDVIAGGTFTLASGKKNFAKVDASGNLYETFNSENAITSGVINIQPWTENSFLVISNTPRRVGADGNLFPNYTVPAPLTYRASGLRPDGQMLVAGSFNSLGSVDTKGLALLEETGAVDPSFLYARPFGENYIKSIAALGEKYNALALELSFLTRGNSSFGVIDNQGRRIPMDVPIFGDIRTIQAYEGDLYVCGYFYDTTINRNASLVRLLTDPAPSIAPTELIATADANAIVLSWSAGTEPKSGFEILRSTNGTDNYQSIGLVSAQDYTFSDATVEGSQTYYYKVVSFTTTGPSPSSNEASTVALPKAPRAPTGIVVTELSPSRIHITWNDESLNETGFGIYSSTTLLGEAPAGATEISIDLLTPGVTYFLKVASYNEHGTSQSSSVVLTLSNPSGGAWSFTTSHAALARSSAVAFSIGSKGYVATGQNQSGRLKDFWEFDPTNNVWSQLTDFPGTARVGAVGFEIGGVGYVGLGNDGSGAFRNDFYKYIPAENAWAPVADFPVDEVGGAGRSAATALVIGSYAYVCFGNNGTNFPTEFYRYDPVNDVWEEMANFPATGRSGAVAFSLDGVGYFGTGGVSEKRSDWMRYFPEENKWYSDVYYQYSPVAGAIAFVNSGRAYVGLGDISNSVLSENTINQFQERNTRDNVQPWRTVNSFSGQARTSAITFTIDDVTYVGLGVKNGVYLDDLHQFASGLHLLPAEVDELSATAVSNHAINLVWTDMASNEDGYLIELPYNGAYQVLTTLPANTNEFLHAGLEKRQTYNYRIRAFNGYGKSAYSKIVNAYTLVPPDSPTSFAAELTNGINIVLSWDHTGEEVTNFILEVSEDDINYSTLSNTILAATKTFTWNNRPAEKQYFFRLRASNDAGSSQAATVNIITTQPKPLPPVINTASVVVGTRRIEFSWSDESANELGFNIYRSTGDGNSVLVNSTADGVTTYTDTDVAPTQSYTYTVSSYNGTGESFGVNNLLVQTDPERIVTITSVEQADPDNGPKVSLTWNGNAESSQEYKIERAMADGAFELLTTVPASTSSYLDTDLEFGKTYHYRMVIQDDVESFDYSNVMEVTLIPPPPIITSLGDQFSAKVYPNPVATSLSIQLEIPMEEAQVLHASGKPIRSVYLDGATSTIMDLSDLITGVYFIKISCVDKVVLLRVVKL